MKTTIILQRDDNTSIIEDVRNQCMSMIDILVAADAMSELAQVGTRVANGMLECLAEEEIK